MMNNPMNIMQMIGMMKNGGNPKDIAMQMLGNQSINNPMINNVIEMMNCNNEKGLEQIARNLCREKGIDINQMMKMFR